MEAKVYNYADMRNNKDFVPTELSLNNANDYGLDSGEVAEFKFYTFNEYFNDDKHVSPELRAKIIKEVAKLGRRIVKRERNARPARKKKARACSMLARMSGK